MERRQPERHRAGRRRRQAGQLVLDVSRPPPRRFEIQARPHIFAGRCSAHSQPRWRSGHEHRNRRRRQSRVEARCSAAVADARVGTRHVRARADRICQATGRDNRPRVSTSSKRWTAGTVCSLACRSARIAADVRVSGDASLHVSHGFADVDPISQQCAERWWCGRRSRWRPVAVDQVRRPRR